MRAAGFEPRRGTPILVQGGAGDVSMSANGGQPGTRLTVSYEVREGGMTKSEAEQLADERGAHHEEDAAALMAAFERGANWTLDTPITWDAGLLHGDC